MQDGFGKTTTLLGFDNHKDCEGFQAKIRSLSVQRGENITRHI